MREIEFRGKLIKSNKWAYGNLDIKKTGTTIITPDDTVLGTYGKVIPETIGQYTGLKDKNGKKIFEGDILLRKSGQFESIVLVKWGKVEFSFLHKSRYDGKIRKGKWTRGTYQGLDGYAEVVGNIYDNPELLKEEL